MNKSEMIALAAENAGVSKKDAERVINAAIDAMTQCLARGERVQLSGFGSFEVRHRSPRTARNLNTRDTIRLPATRVPSFKPSQALKEIVEK